MNKKDLQVIRGGLLDSADTSRRIFVSSYATNTRLMGVIGMYVQWDLPDNGTLSALHQFFYLDAEEFGFETYESVLGPYSDQATEIENSLMGGLGGERVSLTLREAQYLLQQHTAITHKAKLPLPEGISEYGDLLAEPVLLAESELTALLDKLCTKIETPYALINYFLMRCFCKDFKAAAYLAVPGLELEKFRDFRESTFCKNIIDKGQGKDTYINESLIEYNDQYYLVVTSVALDGLHIRSYERISAFKISPSEAAMLLSRSEFVSVYEMLCDPSEFDAASTNLVASAMQTKHDLGVLYMIFHPNNKHVEKKEYRLNEDVLGMYYVSYSGQLISTAYTLEEIRTLERDLAKSSFGRKLVPLVKYEFQEPVVYEFIQSGFEDFELFVEAIKTEEE